ncbi:MAG: DUF4835 domain-containing protein [Bacteroidales bacterium]|nr:MAG: DUF4835 domain-containing protein [Bacteroidales bacterium]
MKKILFLTIITIITTSAIGQELKCKVLLNYGQVQGANKELFDALKKSTEEFMNTTQFTELTFEQNEKIDCSLNLMVKSYEDGIVGCEMQIQTRRPVWGSSYSTPLLNLRDVAMKFAYHEFDAIQPTPTYDNNLSAILSYYAYIIIGYTLDSYQKFGGDNCFEKAENIVNISQSRSEPESEGWQTFDKNAIRYELIRNIMDERFRPYRQYFYEYHRLGLDVMSVNAANGRAKIAKGLNILMETNRLQPQSRIIISFLDAKKDEYVNIFAQEGTEAERDMAYDVLTAINPTSTNTYKKIKERE